MRAPPSVELGTGQARIATRETGCFYVRHPLFPSSRCAEAVELAHAFFDLHAEAKERLGIERSPHFRGYSVMRNERDWREQIHFGREEEPAGRLRGPNLWPADAAWRTSVLQLMRDLEIAGRDVLREFGPFLEVDEWAYLLLKMIRYHGGGTRQGVAAHVDFSWITLLLQDETGGLEIRTPTGDWMEAPFRPGTLLVNLGEILQFATGGLFQATPHRVLTGPRDRTSLPFFLNPSLDRVVSPVEAAPHVHRVLSAAPLHFGEEEWKRKGLGVWCAACC